jgi:hypothetical protein
MAIFCKVGKYLAKYVFFISYFLAAYLKVKKTLCEKIYQKRFFVPPAAVCSHIDTF